jgi:UDP-4-amino-4,6-dideoxy-N-acetyl-beta-L-altrosamine transaminase
MIPYGRQQISEADIAAVVAVLRSDFLTQGPAAPQFERAVAAQSGAKHAIAVNSATSALHIACLALGLGRGDLLWTVPNTFVASANCGRFCGADVDFVDIDAATWDMSVDALHAKLVTAKRNGRLPKVVVPVHFGGQPTEQEAIRALSHEYGFKIIEDASHAIGATHNGERVGSCRWSDITVFSFHPVKIITTAEGGLALTNDDELATRMEILRTHGITRDEKLLQQPVQGLWYYEQIDLGYNYRLNDLQATLGLSQLHRLEEFVERRNVLAANYDRLLATLPVRCPHIRSGNRSAFHLYAIRLRTDAIRKTHREVFEALRNSGIGVNLHYMPVHLQPYYCALGFTPGSFPEAEQYAREAISLPLYPGLTEGQQTQVVQALTAALA